MINFPSPQELNELRAFHEPFCLTIYAPLADPSSAMNPNHIEIKNLLHEAEAALLVAGVKPREAKQTLRAARLLLKSHEFWPVRHESLVLFMHPKLFSYYLIPDQATPYLLSVGTGFNVDPLLQVMQNNQQYYVLALGHKNVRLYAGDHYNLKPVNLKNFPANMEEMLNIDEYPKSRETHTIAPASMGKGSEAYHEQYNVSQTDSIMLLEFFRRIDRLLHNFLMYHHRPLIIAGVRYLLPMYRKVNTYPGLLPGAITGNQEHADLRAIHDMAWPIVKKSLAREEMHHDYST